MVISYVTQIAIGLASSVIGFLLRYLWDNNIRFLIRDRGVRRFWGFLESSTDVYLPFASENLRGAAVGYGDLAALTEFLSLQRRHFKTARDVVVHTNQARFAEWDNRRKNLVVIGGGKYSQVYRELIAELDPPIHFFDTANESFQDIRDADRSIQYLPKYAQDGSLRYDIGLVAWAPNPFSPDSRVVIVAGSHTYGSLAGMLFLADPKVLRRLSCSDDRRHVVVVGAPVQNNSVTHVEQISNIMVW